VEVLERTADSIGSMSRVNVLSGPESGKEGYVATELLK
jgi:hypothetical protein